MKKIKLTILLGMVVFLLTAANASAAWYRCEVVEVTPKPGGAITVVFIPGFEEVDFAGTARASINPNDLGAKNMLATMLTAISLNKDVKLNLAAPPTMTTQDIDGVALKLN